MIRKIIFLIVFMSVIISAQNRVFTDVWIDGDNEGTSSYKYYLGYNRDVLDNFKLGIMAGNRNYNDPEFTNSFKDFRLNGSYTPIDGVFVSTNISFLSGNSFEWNPIFYDGLVTYSSPNTLFYLEGYIEHESVGTAETNNQKYISASTGVSVDYNIFSNFTLVAGFTYNSINNNTNRLYQVYRAIYTLPVDWIYIDAKSKIMTGGDYDPYYFSPNNLSEFNVGVGLNSELGSSQYYARFYIGGGTQTIDSNLKVLFLSNLKVSADFTPQLSGEILAGITNSQNDTYGSFWYEYAKLKITYSF